MNYQKTEGLNLLRKAKCTWMEWLLGTANQTWPESVGKGVLAPAIVVSGTWRVLASNEAP